MKPSTNTNNAKPQNVSASKTKFATLNLNQTYKPPPKPATSG